jgi:hypothetical protein
MEAIMLGGRAQAGPAILSAFPKVVVSTIVTPQAARASEDEECDQ